MRNVIKAFLAAVLVIVGLGGVDHALANDTGAVELTAEERAWVDANPIIKVHNELAWPPFNFNVEGRPRGFSIDVMDLIANKIGLEVSYVSGPSWNEFLELMRTDELDVMLNIVRTPERETYLLYTPPYSGNPSTILSRVDTPYRSIQELAGRTVAIPRGFFYEEILKRDFPDVNLLLVDDTLESMKKVEFGQADAAFGELAVLSYLRRTNFLSGLSVSGEVDLGDPEYSLLNIATRKDLPILASILTKAVNSITPEERNQIETRWLMGGETAPTPTPDERQSTETTTSDHQDTVQDLVMIAAGLGGLLILLVVVTQRMISDNPVAFYSSRTAVGLGAVFVLIIMGGSILATVVALDSLEREVRARVADSLITTLNGRQAHLELWRDAGIHDAEMMAGGTNVAAALRGENAHAHHANHGHHDMEEFVLLRPDGSAIHEDLRHPDGSHIAWRDEFSATIDAVSTGSSAVVKPMMLSNKDGETLPVTFAAAPVYLQGDRISGVILVPMDQRQTLSDVLQSGQFYESGETYAVNQDGLMVSRSRFADQIVSLGLVEKAGDEVLQLRVSDPGINLVETPQDQPPGVDLPLTRMAASVTRGETDFYVDGQGYRDYRGVQVFGAWLWDAQLGIGIATEVDVDEALGPYRDTRLTVMLLVGGVVVVGLFLAGVAILTGRNAASRLGKAKEDLEKRVEERTREVVASEVRIRSIVENAVDGIIVINQEGTVRLFSPAAERIFGYQSAEVVGNNVRMLMPTYLAEQHDAFLHRYLDTGERRIVGSNREVEGQRKDGTAFPMDLAIGETLIDSERSFTGIIRDISDRKAAEAKLEDALRLSRRSLDEINAVLGSIDYAVCFMDSDLCAQVINQAFIDLWGIDDAYIATKPSLSDLIDVAGERGLYDVGDESFTAWRDARVSEVRRGDVSPRELTLADGRTLIYRSIALPDGGRMLTYFDITSQKIIQAEMAEAMTFINESLEYGSRIQQALLPEETMFREIFSDHLLIWKPRDIVGGDLVWLRPADQGFLVLVGDCTGHGVPGAFMTMIANGAIDQALKEVPSGQPGELLGHIHDLVKVSLGQDSTSGASDDGLELGAILIRPDMTELTFAGARFSLYCVDEAGNGTEIKGDRAGLGYRRYDLGQKFNSQTVNIEAGESFYLWSDGIVDQVGGPKRRGFGKRRLLNIVRDYSRMPMEHQRAQILREFETYSHNESVRDDITLFGFKPRAGKRS